MRLKLLQVDKHLQSVYQTQCNINSGNATIGGNITNGSVNLTFPTVGGTISTEGFSIALATALG